MKQTSIEWLIKQIDFHYNGENELYYDDFVQQAKEMHKQEIEDAYHFGYTDAIQSEPKQYQPEKYYLQTFNK